MSRAVADLEREMRDYYEQRAARNLLLYVVLCCLSLAGGLALLMKVLG